MLFSGSSESGHTLVDFLECTEMALSQICLPGKEGKLFQSNCLITGFSAPWTGRRVGYVKMRWDESVQKRERAGFCGRIPG